MVAAREYPWQCGTEKSKLRLENLDCVDINWRWSLVACREVVVAVPVVAPAPIVVLTSDENNSL